MLAEELLLKKYVYGNRKSLHQIYFCRETASIIMKKRNIIVLAAFALAMGLLPACDLIEECGTCKLITEDGSGNVTEGTPLPLCGEALREKQDQAPTTVGSTTTYWDCY